MVHLLKKIKSHIKRLSPTIRYKSGASSSKNIVYILHSSNHKSGGDKVAYRQSELVSLLNINGITGQILHPHNPAFSHKWFEHNAEFKKNLHLDPNRDFVVIPEIWALPHAKLLQEIGIKYAIYVQNGYLTNIPLSIGHEYEELKNAYSNASLILSISDDTTECIKLAFPQVTTKIIKMRCSIDSKIFNISSEKENLITYMPRKLVAHSKLVIFFLKNNLPNHWKIQAIDGLNEEGVREAFSRSKIFLSFNEREGFGLPPVEAALSGNYVVGYTGEGAKEYWESPIFTEVMCGDIRNYVKQVQLKIQQLEHDSTIDFDSIKSLAKKYDAEAEMACVSEFVSTVNSILQ